MENISKGKLLNTKLLGAADDAFNYYGRWRRGPVTVSINSGAMVEFAYTGNRCELLFEVDGFTHYPVIYVQTDNGSIEKTLLSRTTTTVAIHAPYNGVFDEKAPFQKVCSACHMVRWWVASHSLYQTEATGKQWTTLVGGCKFKGVILEDAGELVPLPYGTRQIEFLGDSLTQGLRLLYTGRDADTEQQIPYANWPQLVADLLGLKPIVTGFGGQGLTTAGTCGAPPSRLAFPWIYHEVPWVSLVQPEVVVIYQGINDNVEAPLFQEKYQEFLRLIREWYPATRIFAICPHNQGRYAAAIRSAVSPMNDPNIHFLDYSAGVIAPCDTSDGCHLNPGGAVRLGLRLSMDIRRDSAS